MTYAQDSKFKDSDFCGSTSSNNLDLVRMCEDFHMLFSSVVTAHNSYQLFNSNEWKDGGQSSLNPNEGVRDELARTKV